MRWAILAALLLFAAGGQSATFDQHPEVVPHLESGDPVVIVNIPEFKLRFYRDGELQLESRVILGREDRQTPEIEDQIEFVVLNPYWNLSTKLARRDVLPKYVNDLSGFDRMGYEFVAGWEVGAPVVRPNERKIRHCIRTGDCPFRVRQRPGAANFLGRMKLLFPNGYDIYIHDTPGKHLFGHRKRTFSSGCIRTEHPMELASLVSGMDRSELDTMVAAGARQEIHLDKPVKVVVLKVDVPGALNVYRERRIFSEQR